MSASTLAGHGSGLIISRIFETKVDKSEGYYSCKKR